MTNWLPDISEGQGPLYLRLAERIESDISQGLLGPGDKLPPQRNLAFDIGVTIGTVGRAYAIVRERGLVSGEVGRGTYVLDREKVHDAPSPAMVEPLGGTRSIAEAPGKLRMDSTAAPDVGQTEIIQKLSSRITGEQPDRVADYTRVWPMAWREAGARWLAQGDWSPDPQTVVPTLGVHAAIMAVIASVTAPGDRIAYETLTYSSIARAANLIGRRSALVETDEEGMIPDDFERLCAQQHPKLAFVMPSLQNPTLAILPEDRRRQIADIARRYNVWLIEDAIYGALMEDQPVTLAELAPERVFHTSGLSKAVAAGVRGGWVACPPHYASRVQTAHKMVTGGIPFLLAELAATLVQSGEADAIRRKVRTENRIREAMAREAFDGLDFRSHPLAPFLWMKLPEPWLSATFKQAAYREGVQIDDEDEFKPARTEKSVHRVRIGFSSTRSRAEAGEGFATIRRLLENGGPAYDTYG